MGWPQASCVRASLQARSWPLFLKVLLARRPFVTELLSSYTLQNWLDVFLSQQFPTSVFYLLRQPNTTALAKQSTKYEWTEGRGWSAFKLFWPVLPRMEKVLSENSSNQFDEVSEEIFSGLQSKQSGVWSPDWKRGISYAVIRSSSRGCVGSGDLAYFSSGRAASLSKFSKTTIKTNTHVQNIFDPFPQTPGTGPNICPGFPHHPHPCRGQREDQSTGNGKTSRGKHFTTWNIFRPLLVGFTLSRRRHLFPSIFKE